MVGFWDNVIFLDIYETSMGQGSSSCPRITLSKSAPSDLFITVCYRMHDDSDVSKILSYGECVAKLYKDDLNNDVALAGNGGPNLPTGLKSMKITAVNPTIGPNGEIFCWRDSWWPYEDAYQSSYSKELWVTSSIDSHFTVVHSNYVMTHIDTPLDIDVKVGTELIGDNSTAGNIVTTGTSTIVAGETTSDSGGASWTGDVLNYRITSVSPVYYKGYKLMYDSEWQMKSGPTTA